MGGLYSFLKLWEVQGHSGVDFIGVFDLVHFLDDLDVFVIIVKALGDGGEGISGLNLILADHVLNRDVAFCGLGAATVNSLAGASDCAYSSASISSETASASSALTAMSSWETSLWETSA